MVTDSITCPRCGRTSYNKNDIAEGYCGNCNDWTAGEAPHNIFRDGKVHVLDEMCSTCIFNPATRPVAGNRVAGMVRETMDEPGSTVVCHHTLHTDPQENAICRGWYDRLADRDPIIQMANVMDVLVEQQVPLGFRNPPTQKETP